jgi:hypothetical protein
MLVRILRENLRQPVFGEQSRALIDLLDAWLLLVTPPQV